MGKRNQKILILIVALALLIGLGVVVLKKVARPQATTKIVTSNFIGYDLVRAIMGNDSDVSMLLRPGIETHDFEPTPSDIIKIKQADLIVYVGGESDEWIRELLGNNEISEHQIVTLMDFVELKEEEIKDGMEIDEDLDKNEHDENANEHNHATDNHDKNANEYDEHIWTSPVNTIKLTRGILEKLIELYPGHETDFRSNADEYIKKLAAIDQAFRDVVANSNHKLLIFGDRFPFRYFVDEYGLDYFAAFPGCSEQTEASSKTIAFLVDKIKTENIQVVLKIEMTSDKIANTIANETGAKVLVFNSAHNISPEEFSNGITYADIMEANIKILIEALK